MHLIGIPCMMIYSAGMRMPELFYSVFLGGSLSGGFLGIYLDKYKS